MTCTCSSPLLRLPTSLRVYIFGLSGLGSKLLFYSEAPWKSVFLEYEFFEASITTLDDTIFYPTEMHHAWDRVLAASTTKAFGHALFKVNRQICREAQCALLKFNIVELIGDSESAQYYERWDSERLMALRDVCVNSWSAAGVERIGTLLKDRSDLSNLTIRIQQGLAYADMMWSGFQPYTYEGREEAQKNMAPSYLVFQGARDLFVYYSCCFELEEEHEKLVMGPDYSSIDRGKLSPDVRDYEIPWSKTDPPRPMVSGPD